jgi:3-dehydroquinate dehydratase/shikimate dehydrogenase
MVQAEIQEAGKRGAQLIELRLDFLARAPDFKRLLAHRPCPLIATVRRAQDGGRWTDNEDKRRMLLRQCVVAGFDWVDLETDIAHDIRRYGNVKRIVSYHNLQEVPADIEKIHRRLCAQDADVVKVAVRAQSQDDNLRVLDLLKNSPKPTIALCLGDMGTPSRLLGKKFGAPFTYAAFNPERGIAPGILSFQDMKQVYHYEEIDADTRVYGVIGDPVAQSLSPLIHNTTFRHLGMNCVYVPFRVPRGELAGFLRGHERFPVHGYSVTIPHKEPAAQFATLQDQAVTAVKAANTLVRGESGFTAYNTDYQAALDSLQAHLPGGGPDGPPPLNSRTVLVLGAGGVARAIAHALHRAGAGVTITNRTAEKAQKLAVEIGCRHVDWAARNSVVCDTVVNCTCVGMYPNVDESPVHHSFLKSGLFVFDTVYRPEQTLLVKEARLRGCHVLTGVDMFIRQAALQFQLFSGREAPLEFMQAIIRKALAPVTTREEEDKVAE